MDWTWVPSPRPAKPKKLSLQWKARRKIRKPANTNNVIPLSKFFLERLRRVLAGEGIGPPPRGAIRLYYLPAGYTIGWKLNVIKAHDRTLTDWHALICKYMPSCLPYTVPVDPNPENPFFGHTVFSGELGTMLAKNLRYRWLLRKYLRKLRLRIMNRRIIGADDLATTLPIPIESRVEMYDLRSRSLYMFHTQTIMRIIINGLAYSSYGIASPLVAKNPYTNIPFTLGQLMRIVEQITINLARSHRMLPDSLFSYRIEGYNIANYFRANKATLNIHAAVSFFANKEDPVVIEIYEEIMEDVYKDLDGLLGKRAIINIVKVRKAPAELQSRWDKITIAFWIYENHHMFFGWPSYDDMLREFKKLHQETMCWHRIRRRGIVNRRIECSNTITQYLNTYIDAMSVVETDENIIIPI